nr:metallophosphoesterase [Oryzomonas rubra]
MRIIHTGDWHISRNADKREESERCILAMINHAQLYPPDLFVISGDTVDELDGRIMLDSEVAHSAIELVDSCAGIAPVVIIRGTRSHDRDTPAIFRHLRTVHRVHVASQVEQVALIRYGDSCAFNSYASISPDHEVVAALTLVPSLDKAYLMAQFEGSARDGNMQARELMHDLFAGLGMVNDSLPAGIPKIFVGHGMLTGSEFSTGQVAVGEDLEFSVNDLHQAHCDYYALGHVHKYQQHGGNVFFCGSPGRLNYGEQEDKGFLEVTFGSAAPVAQFMPLPARRLCFGEAIWDGDEAAFEAEVARVEAGASGADVRFRYSIPEEDRHRVDRALLEQRFMAGGARKVKIECQVVPAVRQRAAGISQARTLAEKVAQWGATSDVAPITLGGAIEIASNIESRSVEELVAGCFPVVEAEPAPVDRKESTRAALNRYFENNGAAVQGGLF